VRYPAKAREHHRQAWSWRLYGADNILSFLAQVLQYMHCPTKVQRARMLTEEYKSVTPRNGWYTDEARLRRREFEDRFMAIGAGRGSRGIPRSSGG
jgi:hypothetical protein